MPTINFYLQGKNNPTGIYVRLREGVTIDAKAKTKFVINPSDWSAAKRYLKHTKDEKFKKLDEDLQELKRDILIAFNNSVKEKTINSEWLKSVIDPVKHSAIPLTLVEYFDYYREKQRYNLMKSSYNKLIVVKNFIIRLEKGIKKKILISEVNEDFIQLYMDFGSRENYSQNYLARNFKFIKTVCYDAELRGIKIDFQLRRLKIKETPTIIIYLTPNEIEAIENIHFEREALLNARDWLIISCETAQRVSDFLGYKIEDIRYEKNTKGKKVALLDIVQKKTKNAISIPLSSKVMKIIERRGGKFPRKISDQKYNEYIKEIAKEAGLTQLVNGSKQDVITRRKVFGKFPKWELVTSHIGRRSYATNKFGVIPTSLIMTMTGHKTEREFLKYIGKSETSMAMQLAEYID
jgi:integrase